MASDTERYASAASGPAYTKIWGARGEVRLVGAGGRVEFDNETLSCHGICEVPVSLRNTMGLHGLSSIFVSRVTGEAGPWRTRLRHPKDAASFVSDLWR